MGDWIKPPVMCNDTIAIEFEAPFRFKSSGSRRRSRSRHKGNGRGYNTANNCDPTCFFKKIEREKPNRKETSKDGRYEKKRISGTDDGALTCLFNSEVSTANTGMDGDGNSVKCKADGEKSRNKWDKFVRNIQKGENKVRNEKKLGRHPPLCCIHGKKCPSQKLYRSLSEPSISGPRCKLSRSAKDVLTEGAGDQAVKAWQTSGTNAEGKDQISREDASQNVGRLVQNIRTMVQKERVQDVGGKINEEQGDGATPSHPPRSFSPIQKVRKSLKEVLNKLDVQEANLSFRSVDSKDVQSSLSSIETYSAKSKPSKSSIKLSSKTVFSTGTGNGNLTVFELSTPRNRAHSHSTVQSNDDSCHQCHDVRLLHDPVSKIAELEKEVKNVQHQLRKHCEDCGSKMKLIMSNASSKSKIYHAKKSSRKGNSKLCGCFPIRFSKEKESSDEEEEEDDDDDGEGVKAVFEMEEEIQNKVSPRAQ